MKWKTIIVLAKSYKKRHWCIAGRELVENNKGKYDIHGWIRPISSDTDSQGAIFDNQCRLRNGDQTSVLDIVRIPFDSHAPEPGQPENWLILEGTPWEKVERYSPDKVKDFKYFKDNPTDLWLEPGIQTDRISLAYGPRVGQSLHLIKPSEFYLYKPNIYGRKYRADFMYKSTHYDLSVTDPIVWKRLDRKYPVRGGASERIRLKHNDDYYLCISLGAKFGYGNQVKRHYKFVAAIFGPDGSI